jgi:hypothetical protein
VAGFFLGRPASVSADLTTLLPPPRPPYMIKDTFAVKADLFPLGGTYNGYREGRHFEVDAEIERYIDAKLTALRDAPHLHHLTETDDPPALAEAIWRVFRVYAGEWPDVLAMAEPDLVDIQLLGLRVDGRADRTCPAVVRLPGLTPLGARVAAQLDSHAGLCRLADALALSCQEDLVIMRGFEDGSDVAEWLHVCIPSGWDPAEKVGTSFRAIHAPVADNARLVASGPNVIKAMIGKGPYIRFGWGLTTNPYLNSHPATRPPPPDLAALSPADVADRTYLRMERQTTLALPDLDRALFTVRIYLDPIVHRVVTDPGLRPRLTSLISSCSPDVVAYKGMTDLVGPIMEWLRGEPPYPSS